jgi:hypothetical protein
MRNPNSTMKKMGLLQAIELSKQLEKVCRKGPDGFAEYDEGFSDGKIHMLMGDAYSINNVIFTRRKMFGDLRRARAPDMLSNADLLKRIADLEQIVTDLAGWAGRRPKMPFNVSPAALAV